MESEFLAQLRKSPFLGILRDIHHHHVPGIVRVSHEAGVRFLEVTMNTANARSLIEAMRSASQDLDIHVGAGTVCTVEDVEIAYEAGATFVVSPGLFPDVLRKAQQLGMATLPGAITPTEIFQAHQLGATCVKVFPVRSMGGPSYIRDLRGPFRHIPLLACGGVNAENCEDYFDAGSDAVAFGAGIFKPDWLARNDWDAMSVALRKLVLGYKPD